MSNLKKPSLILAASVLVFSSVALASPKADTTVSYTHLTLPTILLV